MGRPQHWSSGSNCCRIRAHQQRASALPHCNTRAATGRPGLHSAASSTTAATRARPSLRQRLPASRRALLCLPASWEIIRCCASATRCPFGCAGAAARFAPCANTRGPLPCGGMRRRATASHRSATPLAVQSGARAHPPVCPRPATARRSTAGRPSPRAPLGRRRPPAQPRRPFCARQPHEAPHSSPYIPRCRPPAAPQTRPGPRGPARARRPPSSRGPKPASPSPGRLLLRPCCARAPCRGACASNRSPTAAHHSAHAPLAFQLLLFEKQSTEALVTDANLQGCEPMQTCSLHEHGDACRGSQGRI